MRSYEVYRSPNDGGGPSPRDDQPKPEQLRTVGDLTEFLQKDFLGSAAKSGIMSEQDATRIPLLVNDVLVSLTTHTGSDEESPDFIAISSVPRTIARKISAGSVYEGSWEYYSYLRDVMSGLADSENEKLRTFAESFAELSVDLDVKIDGLSDKTPLNIMADRIARANHIEVSPAEPTRNFSFQVQDYTVEVQSGKSPTSPIDLLKIYFRNSDNNRELFHIDVTKAGIYPDKRAAITTYIQDNCTAKLENIGGRIQYGMTQHAVETLDRQDVFDAEVKNSGALLEIFLRGLRQSLLPPKRQVILVNGETLPLPQFDMLFPLFQSAVSQERPSLFGLRRTMVQLMLQGEIGLPRNEKQIRLLQKVLFDCLTFDPYTTVQALRDSGVTLTIPGLRKYSMDDWNSILRSPEFILAPIADGTAYPRANERILEVMASERDKYVGLSGRRRFDGFERFMHALGSEKGKEWEDYLALWEESIPISKKVVAVFRRKLPKQFNAIQMEDAQGNIYWIVRKGGSIKLSETSRIQTLLNEQELRKWKQRMKSAIVSINGNSHDTSISRMYKAKRGILWGDSESQKILRSIAAVGAIMQLAPFGLTAKELRDVYEKADPTMILMPFEDAFYRFKLTGSVVRNTELRANKKGEIMPTPMYIWQDPRKKTRLVKSIEEEEKMLPPQEVAVNSFIRSGIYTAEVLLALTEQDIQLLRKDGAQFYVNNLNVAQEYIQNWLGQQSTE